MIGEVSLIPSLQFYSVTSFLEQEKRENSGRRTEEVQEGAMYQAT
ncbi:MULTISPECIES: hypothetical protein [unclassified Moorena]|uniref:Uncharacterized protein n=1 Tax=Moorena producens 3L TaxID=489825 RepID=F4XLG0_9CYAN|nr:MULTISPECIES: hypothetical protein [unclassified Moorena]EGJ34572.1 hypothetical protein LYNGBM3L_14780 [Moorena producens 3L]